MGAVALAPAAPAYAATAADDQARLDRLIEAFEARMTAAGWVGAPADDDDDDEEGGDAGDDGSLSDEQFAACLGQFDPLFQATASSDELPGQTALRESLDFTYTPPGDPVPSTTDGFDFEVDPEEHVAAFAVSVDAASVPLLDMVVELIGAKSTGECITEAMDAAMTEVDDDALDAGFDVTVSNEPDLGVGHNSARMDYGLSADMLGPSFVIDVALVSARTDRHLVLLLYSTTGGEAGPSGFDPLAELGLLAAAVAA